MTDYSSDDESNSSSRPQQTIDATNETDEDASIWLHRASDSSAEMMLKLPSEVLVCIADFLNDSDRLRMSETCRVFDECVQSAGLVDLKVGVSTQRTVHNRVRKPYLPNSQRFSNLISASSIRLFCDSLDASWLERGARDLLNSVRQCRSLQLWCGEPPHADLVQTVLNETLLPMLSTANVTGICITSCDDTHSLVTMVSGLLDSCKVSLERLSLVLYVATYSPQTTLPPLPTIPNLTRIWCNTGSYTDESRFPIDWICAASSQPDMLSLSGFTFDNTLKCLQNHGAGLRKLAIGSWHSEFGPLLPNLTEMTANLRSSCQLAFGSNWPAPNMPPDLEYLEILVCEEDIDRPVLEELPNWLKNVEWGPQLECIGIRVYADSLEWIEDNLPAVRELVEVCEEQRGIDIFITSNCGWPNYPDEPL